MRERDEFEERFCYKGDTERLKAGGREMLVVGFKRDRVVCEWIEHDVIILKELYLPKELVLIRRA